MMRVLVAFAFFIFRVRKLMRFNAGREAALATSKKLPLRCVSAP